MVFLNCVSSYTNDQILDLNKDAQKICFCGTKAKISLKLLAAVLY